MRLKSIPAMAVLMPVVIFSQAIGAESNLRFSGIENSVNHEICTRILEQVYKDIGIKISTRAFPAERALILSNSGKFDGEVQRIDGISRDYPNLIKVPEPIFFLEGSAFVKNAEIVIHGWDSLAAYKIGIPRGIRYLEANTDGMNRIIASSLDQLFHLLNAGRIDVVVISTNYGQDFLNTHSNMNVKMVTPPIIRAPLYHYLHKKHKALVSVVETGIIKLKKEGKINRISE